MHNKKQTHLKKITRIFVAVSLMATMWSALFANVSADIGKDTGDVFNEAIDGMFKEDGDGILSLTDFKGGLQAPSKEGLDPSLTQVTSAREFVFKVVNYLLSFLGLAAVIITIYGGIRIMTSVGESDGVEKGRKAITYALVGIVVIAASYAIVNFALKAPGGIPATQPGTGVAVNGTPFGAAPIEGKNAQALRVYNILNSTITSYSNYAQARLATENIQQSIDRLWNGSTFNSDADASSALTQIETNYAQMAETLQGAAAKSAVFSTVGDMVQYQRLLVKKWLEERQIEIDLLKKTPVETGKFGGVENFDEDEIQIKSGDDFLAYNCSNDTPITVPGDDECIRGRFGKKEYTAHFSKKYTQLVNTLKSGQYEIENGKVNIGVNGMKLELAKDFDAQMDANSKDLKSVQTALSRPDGSLIVTAEGKEALSASASLFSELKQNKASPIESKKTLKEIATRLGRLYEILKNLQGVEAKLTATVREGNAPLIVTFKTQGSRDPSNLSITDENIFWDLDGDGNFGITGKERNSTDCVEPKAATATCIYKKPGTYRVAVKIKSAAMDKGIIEGVEYLDIKVNPPRARFNIQLTTNNNGVEQRIPVTAYDKNGLTKIDRGSVQLAYSDIAKSLKFSAIGTVSGSIEKSSAASSSELSKMTSDTIQHVRWSFGDGAEIDDSPSENPNILTIDHAYARKGIYQVMLEVTGKDGITDRKIFTINVADISAIITVNPGYTVKVNSPITFSSTVTSDGSRVISTEWSATPDIEKLRSREPQFSAAIDKPGTYAVTLKVQNENNAEATDRIDVTVESNPPVARFSSKTPVTTSPTQILFDASQTYDPDGENSNLLYQWNIEGEQGKDYKILKGSETEKTLLAQFLTTGEKKIELVVEDANEKGKTSSATQTINIKSLLDVSWSESLKPTGILDENGEAEVNLEMIASGAKSYSFDYGDGEVEDGAFADESKIQVKHIYRRAGVFIAYVSVEDESGNTLKLSKRISIGSGQTPIVSTQLLVNGVAVEGDQMIEITRKDVITFDASNSRNRDGTAENLVFSLDFGDGKKSTKSSATYTYKTLSPKSEGFYTAKITVSDKKDPTKKAEDNYKINVLSLRPEMKTLLVVPLSANFKTPLRVQLKAVNAKAPEGSIVSYRWWYLDPKDDTNELGSQITTTPETTLTVGTKGAEGEQVTYVFQVELRDSENQVITADEILGKENLPTLTVTNGANKPPMAKITVNKTSVSTGETITFSSASTDADGKIVSYIWDLDGNGFQNDQPTTKSSVSKSYTSAAPNGIKVRLKVVDDSYAEAVSDPFIIYVTSPTTPPKPAFTITQKSGTLEVTFKNNSTFDAKTKLSEIFWDFDTNSIYNSADSDGDGTKDNDKDSSRENPTHTYQAPGTYYVKLTLKDTAGVISSSRFPIEVKPISVASPLTPNFQSQVGAQASLTAKLITAPIRYPVDNKVHIIGNSGNITLNYASSTGNITRFVIDKNIYFDSNGDGIADNDENYKAVTPGQWITDFRKEWGKIGIKLTVYDASGKSSSDTVEVVFDAQLQSGANNMFAVSGAFELASGLATMFGFGILSYRSRRNKNRQV